MTARSCSLFLAVATAFSAAAWNPPQSSSAAAAPAKAGQLGTTPSGAPNATPAQQKPEPVYESANVLRAITRLVSVDVVAENKKGEPITDLKLSDFTVLEDGKQQTFNFQQPMPQPASTTPVPVSARLPENIYSNIPSYKSSSALNIVLLDALNTTTLNQVTVRDQMIHYLETMPEGRPLPAINGFAHGTYILRLGVRDLNTGLIGTTNAKVAVPASETASQPAQKER